MAYHQLIKEIEVFRIFMTITKFSNYEIKLITNPAGLSFPMSTLYGIISIIGRYDVDFTK